MEWAILPAWEDNFIFILHKNGEAIIIDPTDAKVVEDFLQKHQLKPIAILNTHHHPDHIGGNKELYAKYKMDVYCSEYDKERVPHSKHLLKEGQIIKFWDEEFKILDLKGHTLGLIGYHIPNQNLLFSGDCIFSLGCGYLFEGTAEQAQSALEKISNLPEETKICCSHEYTLANGEFQLSIDKKTGLEEMLEEKKKKRSKGLFTIPTTVGFEKEWNMFLRWDDEELKKELNLNKSSKAEFFSILRKMKNNF